MDDDQEATEAETLLDIDGLAVGLAFHPDYERNGFIYIGLNGPMRRPERRRQVVRYTVDRRPPHRIDPDVEAADHRVALQRPRRRRPRLRQRRVSLRLLGGRVQRLRRRPDRPDDRRPARPPSCGSTSITPTPGRNYGVPEDNPFVDRPGARPEVWAYGLRNPWRLSYDRESGQLWVGKNGQDLWEQVYLIQKGGNYGWSLTEGSHIFNAGRKAGPDPILPPAAEHPHSEARSLTGGRVYRGTRLPELAGPTFMATGPPAGSGGSSTTARRPSGTASWSIRRSTSPASAPTTPASSMSSTSWAASIASSRRPRPTGPTQPFPTRLSETGLFASVAAHKPHPAALPYDVSAPQWADGATMERFAALPGLERIEQKPQLNAGGAWTLPDGSVLVQTLSLDRLDAAGKPARKRIETRLLVRQQGEWTGYSYRWNAEQTDAELVAAAGAGRGARGARPDRAGRPSRADLAIPRAHRVPGLPLAGGRLHPGLQPAPARSRPRLRRHRRQPAPHPRAHRRLSGRTAPQARRPAAAGQPLRGREAPLEARVKSYLHVNCSTCHVNEGGGNARMELGLDTPARQDAPDQ